MNFNLFNRPLKTANIVFTDSSIRFMETIQKPKQEILQMKEHPLTPGMIKEGKITNPEMFRIVMEQCVTNWNIKRRDVRFLIPDPFIIVRQVNVPVDIQEDELNGYLFLETGTSIHLPFEDPVIDSVILKKEKNHQEILLVAAPREIVESYVQLFEDVKLKAEVAEISPLSLYRLYKSASMTKKDDHVLLLNYDKDLLTISIFHDDIPIFVRPITAEFLLQNTIEMIGEEDAFYIDDAIAEIEKVMDFYQYTLNQGKVWIKRVILSGDHHNLHIVRERLRNRLQLPVDQLELSEYATIDGKIITPSYFSILGLSLKEVDSK
ncbi:type IV pilus biogenesis protein PilM [Lederbergia wuyishanensis]|uniref:Type IV pilus assembly protein PilM n=1 Tax=Lederbergia wuyishanensis TaxID=1347903 RepID=A0ABU0D1X2_9BACI|nr:pilus assembly protein PilM [Lederbergia wuyishanensis]MCJ8006988.1 pilus assembly protein PilM [Lederbergia wuyishanensis]MDQ0342372.1 type IV pilus assembly protein PilM [Lederbergia wuyishanensis]